MNTIILIVFLASLIYFFMTERISKYIYLLFFQGILLFIIAFINLIEINTLQLIVILFETLLIKAIIVPYYLNKIRKTNNIKRLSDSHIHGFFSILIMTALIILSFFSSYSSHSQLVDFKFLTIATSTILCGIFFVIAHKNLFNHIVGFLIVENGAFLLSLAVGGEFPFLVSMAVLIDILIVLLILGVFVNKIGRTFGNMYVSSLNELKD